MQLVCNEGRKAILQVNSEGNVGEIYFCDGEVVHASILDLEGEEAFKIITRLSSGDFALVYGVEAPQQTISKSWSSLLLEVMHTLDQSQEDGEKDNLLQLSKKLQAIEGVNGLVVASPDGVTVIGIDKDLPLPGGFTAAFLYALGMEFGEKLGLGEFDHFTVQGDNMSLIVFARKKRCFMALVDPAVNPEPVLKRMLNFLKLMG